MSIVRVLVVVLNLYGICAFASESPRATPESMGFSKEGLDRIRQLNDNYVRQGKVPGIVTLVARHGHILFSDVEGILDVETQAPLKEDSLFRIYSMSKPIAAIAALILYEEGKFQMDAPLDRIIPEFKDMKVLVDGKEVAPEKPMTMRMLLTHSAGFTYGFFSDGEIDKRYREAKILQNKDLNEMVQRLKDIPLEYQPGTQWKYSIASDLVGAVVERLSGQPFDVFLRERIFAPLKMDDTFFQVPAAKIERFGTNHQRNESGELQVVDSPRGGRYVQPVTFFSGGGGLVSTAPDYMRFCLMLLNQGSLDGVRILGPKTVQFLRQNHLPNDLTEPFTGGGFGLGFSVRENIGRGDLGSVGEYWWGGAAGTFFWIDPVEDLTVIGMIQHMQFREPLQSQTKVLTYSALTELAQ